MFSLLLVVACGPERCSITGAPGVGETTSPADFCVVPNDKGLLVVVPDLVKGELRFVQIAN